MSSPEERRRYKRRPKLMRFTLLWKREEETAFTTDVCLGGMFLRTAMAPPQGSQVELKLPEERPNEECLRLIGTVVRIVRRGDPSAPLGGIGIRLERIVSPRGTKPAQAVLTALLETEAPQLVEHAGTAIIELPLCTVSTESSNARSDETEEPAIEEFTFEHQPVTAELAVFCRVNNMVIQASLLKLGTNTAVLGNIQVPPAEGDMISVRMINSKNTLFRGVEFTGKVDSIELPEGAGPRDAKVHVSIDPMGEQRDSGGLISIIKQLSDTREPVSEQKKGSE